MVFIGQDSGKLLEDTDSSGIELSGGRARGSSFGLPGQLKLPIDPPAPHLERHDLIEASPESSAQTGSTLLWEHYTFGSIDPISPLPPSSPKIECEPATDPRLPRSYDGGSVSSRTPSTMGGS